MYICAAFSIYFCYLYSEVNIVKQREYRQTVDQHQTVLRGCDFCQRLYHKMATAAQTFGMSQLLNESKATTQIWEQYEIDRVDLKTLFFI